MVVIVVTVYVDCRCYLSIPINLSLNYSRFTPLIHSPTTTSPAVHGLPAVREFLASKVDASKRAAVIKKEKKAERKRNKRVGEAASGVGGMGGGGGAQEPAVVVGPAVTEQAS